MTSEVRFNQVELVGATFRDCDLSGLRIVDSILGDAEVSGDFDRLVVNDVDVTGYVSDELDRRQPERVLVRALRTPQDHRDTWAAVERMWAATHQRLAGLPASVVEAGWARSGPPSETLRHLVFATDAWAAVAILGRERPYHPAGLPAAAYPADKAAGIGVDPGLTPSLADLLPVRAERMALVAGIVAGLTEAELDRVCDHCRRPATPSRPGRSPGACA